MGRRGGECQTEKKPPEPDGNASALQTTSPTNPSILKAEGKGMKAHAREVRPCKTMISQTPLFVRSAALI